jgi:hypothetical protein
MEHTLPSFENDEVALLISAVEKSLERLYKANERVGGNDAELIEYGRPLQRHLQKLQAALRSQPAS